MAATTRGMIAITVPRASKLRARQEVIKIGGGVGTEGENRTLRTAQMLLTRYLDGEPGIDLRKVPLDVSTGTPLQRQVWQMLREIPTGETRTYGEIAKAVGRPRAARAIGQCNARNPWAIVVPCHRLVGSQGQLTGYGGGIDLKRRLLDLEGASLTAHRAKMLAAARKRRDLDAHRN